MRMIGQFLNDFFCQPIVQYSGYNPINTIVYAIILIGITFGLIFPWLKRSQIPLDGKFMLSLVPFIVLGSSFRILEDLHLLPRSCDPLSPWFYTITPGVYIFIGLLTIFILALCMKIGKKDHSKTLKIFSATGLVLALPIVAFLLLRFKVWDGFIGVFAFAAILLLLGHLVSRSFQKTRSILHGQLNKLVFFGQMLDASATFTAIQFYTCSEQHVLSAGIINAFGPIGFVAAKFLLMLAVLYFADKEIENKHLANFIKIVIGIIGFAPGIRDGLTLAVGTCL